jgi:hypothetical protein
LEILEDRLVLATYTVINTSDSGSGSFRQAILDANFSHASSTIEFRLSGGGVQTFTPSSAYPALTVPVIIDGTTEAGYHDSPLIVLDGINTTGADGIDLTAGASTIRGLDIQRFSNAGIGLLVAGGDAVTNCYIGTDQRGLNAFGNGIGIDVESNGNTIGGTGLRPSNLISGNQTSGIKINNSTNNTIADNYLGTNADGSGPIGNGIGVAISGGGNNTIGAIGGNGSNIISGNNGNGVDISSRSTANTILGNYVGTDRRGETPLANNGDGLSISGQADANTVGGTSFAYRNVLSGNVRAGVDIIGSTVGNQVRANFIGCDASGHMAIPNATGVTIVGGGHNQIGGLAPSNVISGNLGNAVELINSTANTIAGNCVGTDASRELILLDSHNMPFGNRGDGILLSGGSSNNAIGTSQGGMGNLIGGNAVYGVEIRGGSGNTLEQEVIGTDAGRGIALPNGSGIVLSTATGTIVGGTSSGSYNVICGNTGDGLDIWGGTSSQVQDNFIGIASEYSRPLPNGGNGVVLGSGATNTTIGGTINAARNVISGNAGSGVVVRDPTTSHNFVFNNFVGTDRSATMVLPNRLNGIEITNGATQNAIGGTLRGEGNVIANNGNDGVLIDTGSQNAIRANSIFAHPAGQAIHLINGGNNSMPSPVITSIVGNGAITIFFAFTYARLPDTEVTCDFLASPNGNLSGPGDGKVFLGSTTVMTDSAGSAAGTFTFNVMAGLGSYYTVTATDPAGNTSPISLSFFHSTPNGQGSGPTTYPPHTPTYEVQVHLPLTGEFLTSDSNNGRLSDQVEDALALALEPAEVYAPVTSTDDSNVLQALVFSDISEISGLSQFV